MLTISPTAGDTIDKAATSATITTDGDKQPLYSDGVSNWNKCF